MFAASMALGAGFAEIGCKIDDGGDEEGGADTGEPPPDMCLCTTNNYAYGECTCDNGQHQTVCGNEASCSAWCFLQETSFDRFVVMSCSNFPDEGSCGGWAPSGQVALVNGVRRVDDVWLANLVADPSPLWSCDDAALDDINGGRFTVINANSGELLYELGLRNGDIPWTLNGMPLFTVQDGFDVLRTQYMTGVTSYTLVVKRGTSFITFSYAII